MHPAAVVHVGAHARVELGDGVEVVAFLREVLQPATATHLVAVVDPIPPLHLEGIRGTRGERLGQVHPHHGLVDGVLELTTTGVGNAGDLVPALEGLGPLPDLAQAYAVADGTRADRVGITVGLVDVLVQLQPEVAELVGTLIVVGDGLAAHEFRERFCPAIHRLDHFHMDVVVGLHLPIGVAGCAAGSALLVGCG